MKKALSIALSMLTIFALTACSNGEKEPASASGETSDTAVTPAGTLPIVNEKTDLKVMILANALVANYETNEFTKWLEEQTNVHIVWDVVPKNNANEKLNVQLASGDYPDVILGFNVPNSQQMIYGSQGVFLPLNEMIDNYGVETKRVFEQNPQLKDEITAPDGNIYGLPDISGCYHCSMGQKMWIYKPWLDKLGLSLPTTTDELYDVLKAFKENDPNGNGEADEIPYAGWVQADKSVNMGSFLLNSFTYNNITAPAGRRLFVDNGKVTAAFAQSEWKEGLKYLKKLYSDGILYAPSFTQDATQMKQLAESPAAVVGAVEAQSPGGFTQLNGKSGRWKEFVAVPPLKGPEGFQNAAFDPYTNNTGNFIITKAAKNPEAAFRLADFLYSEEATMRESYGVPDTDWRKAKPGELGLDGQQGQFIRIAKKGDTQNSNWVQGALGNRSFELKKGEVTAGGNEVEGILYNETKTKYEPHKEDAGKVLPPLFFTIEQSSMLADLEKTISDYVNEMYARFIIGDANIDNEWDNYLKTLDSMGLKKYLQLYQDALDAKSKS